MIPLVIGNREREGGSTCGVCAPCGGNGARRDCSRSRRRQQSTRRRHAASHQGGFEAHRSLREQAREVGEQEMASSRRGGATGVFPRRFVWQSCRVALSGSGGGVNVMREMMPMSAPGRLGGAGWINLWARAIVADGTDAVDGWAGHG